MSYIKFVCSDDSSGVAKTGSLPNIEQELSSKIGEALSGTVFERLGGKSKPRNASVDEKASNKRKRSPIRFVITGHHKKPRRQEEAQEDFSPDSPIGQRGLPVAANQPMATNRQLASTNQLSVSKNQSQKPLSQPLVESSHSLVLVSSRTSKTPSPLSASHLAVSTGDEPLLTTIRFPQTGQKPLLTSLTPISTSNIPLPSSTSQFSALPRPPSTAPILPPLPPLPSQPPPTSGTPSTCQRSVLPSKPSSLPISIAISSYSSLATNTSVSNSKRLKSEDTGTPPHGCIVATLNPERMKPAESMSDSPVIVKMKNVRNDCRPQITSVDLTSDSPAIVKAMNCDTSRLDTNSGRPQTEHRPFSTEKLIEYVRKRSSML